jgi:hypothetical protein
MKLLIIAGLILCVCSSIAAGETVDDLSLHVRLTTGERSRDSNSESTTLALTPGSDIIKWKQTFSGRRHGTAPEPKEFRLSPEDRASLIKLTRAGNLLVTNSIALPEGTGFSFFAISVGVTLDGKTGDISISGPRTAKQIKEQKLYQDTLALVKEIYRIINAQDANISFEDLVIR